MRLVGHKGADLIARGNTAESFKAAVDAGAAAARRVGDVMSVNVIPSPDPAVTGRMG